MSSDRDSSATVLLLCSAAVLLCSVALLLLYCCSAAALLLLYCCSAVEELRKICGIVKICSPCVCVVVGAGAVAGASDSGLVVGWTIGRHRLADMD